MKIVEYEAARFNDWNNFNMKAKNGALLFDRNYMEYHADRFEEASLMFEDNGSLIGVLPATRSDDVLISHGGLTYGGLVVGEDMKQARMDACFAALIPYLREKGIMKLEYRAIPRIYHSYPAEEDLFSLFCLGAVLVRRNVSTTINLRDPYKMTKGRKAQISRAKREGVKILRSDDFIGFIKLENEILATRHHATACHTGEDLARLARSFPDNIRLYVAMKDANLLAGAVVYIWKRVAHTQYMANSDYGCRVGALDLLISEVLGDIPSHVDYFDFGTSMDGMSPNSTLIFQKESFGGRTTLYDTYELTMK